MKDKPTECKGKTHEGPDRSSPYPVSRLAPAIELVDLAREISEADKMLNARVGAKLKVIADQIRALQKEARSILDEAKQDQDLNHARCSFQRKPGNIYHLYREKEGSTYFSMLSPEDWQGKAPHEFVGSYRLENDMTWTDISDNDRKDNTRFLVEHLLSAREEEKG